MKATPEQIKAVRAIREWCGGRDRFLYVAGYAGTGKSTLMTAPTVLGMLGTVAFATPTHKAADVLRRKLAAKDIDVPVETIYAAVYGKPTEYRQCSDCGAVCGTDVERPPIVAAVCMHRSMRTRVEFNRRKAFGEQHPLWGVQTVIVDEVSMVPAQVMRDLLALPVRVIGVGDPYQLPPVQGGAFVDGLRPDAQLTEVQRAALDSPITRLATLIRNDGLVAVPRNDPNRMAGEELRFEGDASELMFVCATNRTRQRLNRDQRMARFGLGPTDLPRACEPVMARANYRNLGIFNAAPIFNLDADATAGTDRRFLKAKIQGQTFDAWRLGFTADDALDQWRNMPDTMRGAAMRLQFAYAITGHSSQGSEWETVVLVETQGWGSALDRSRWLYTATTRASQRLLVVGAA